METPVMYFYAARETKVAVKILFPEGTITEWYPHASSVGQTAARKASNPVALIQWDDVRLLPGSHATFPTGSDGNHYYAARDTAATPLRVNARGVDEDEKFLFYRGVSSSPLPIAATITPEGRVNVRNLGSAEIPGVMLIESRDGKLGYRMAGRLQGQALLDPPALTASREVMMQDLQRTLVAQGLYEDEARAMIATWRNSWFEEGSRLLYILPASAVNALLPLTVKPVPAQTERVFVGRLELVTAATERDVEQAFAAHDEQTLDKYRRFLEPILRAMIAQSESQPERKRLLVSSLTSVYAKASASPWRN